MSQTYTLTDGSGNCIFQIPGDCITYTGTNYGCGVIPGISFNETVLRIVQCVGLITTTTTTTSSTSSTTSTSTSTTTTSTTSTSTTSTSTTTTSTSSTTTTTTSHGSTTTTTSTSTTSTSTTSTSTTTTTTTSTTTTTTSSTTTTTTTLPSATIYWGAQSSSTPPNSGQVIAQSSSVQNPAGIVNVSWVIYNASPQYCWAWIPAAYPKTKWFDTGSNNGNIGGSGDLFTIVSTVIVGGVSGSVYMTQFQTQFAEATQLQP